VGRPPAGDQSKDYLLRPLTMAERAAFHPNIERAADGVIEIIQNGLERAMNRFNLRA